MTEGTQAGCGAPATTLYFAPDGWVRACCVNVTHPLGRIGRDSLPEIWAGARRAALQAAVEGGDWSLGCHECGDRIQAGNRAWSNAPQFDHLAAGPEGPPPFPRRMDFVLSNTCNLMCLTCSGELSSAIRARREGRPPLQSPYDDRFFDELRPLLAHLEETVFLGGEPFLVRQAQRVWDLLIDDGLAPDVRIVTNGTQWNDRVERVLSALPASVTVSVDGATAETFEALRVGADHAEVLANVDRYEATVAPHGGTVGYHYCLVTRNWHELGPFLLAAEERGRWVQVMTVTHPAEHSVFRLPAAELRPVVDGLEAADASVRSGLHDLLPVWEAELDRLRRHLDRLERGERLGWVPSPHITEVTISPRPRPRPDVVTPLEAELARASDRPLLVLHGRDGLVEQVEGPDWASELDLDGLVGITVEELHLAFCQRLGPAPMPQLTACGAGQTRVEGEYPWGRVRAISTEHPLPEGRRSLRIAIAVEPAPAGSRPG